MTRIKFENGIEVNFNGTPTVQEIEEISEKLNINKGITPPKIMTQSSTPLGTGTIGGVASGLAKTGFNILKSGASIGEKIIRTPYDLLTGKGIKESWKAPVSADVIQSNIERKKNILPGTLLEPATKTESVSKTMGDVAMFFGPAGLEKKIVGTAELALNIPKLIEVFGPKLAPLVVKIVKTSVSGMTTGASMAGVTSLEGGTSEEIIGAGKAGIVLGGTAKLVETFASGLLKVLSKNSLKLPPSSSAKVANKIDAATTFMSENGLSVNPKNAYKELEIINNKFENALSNSMKKDVYTSKTDLINEIFNIPEQFKSEPAIYEEIKRDTMKAIKIIKDTQGDKINISSLLNGKRSYGKAAFGKSSAVVKTSGVISEGDYAIEKAYENVLEKTLVNSKESISIPIDIQRYFGGKSNITLSEFNKIYSQAINAKKFANIAQFKNDAALVGRLFGLWVGRSLGTAIAGPGLAPEIIGATAGEILSVKIPQTARSTAEILLKKTPKTLVPAGKIGVGVSNEK